MADEEKSRYEKLTDILYKYQYGPANYRLEDAFVATMQVLIDDELEQIGNENACACHTCEETPCGCHKTVGG